MSFDLDSFRCETELLRFVMVVLIIWRRHGECLGGAGSPSADN